MPPEVTEAHQTPPVASALEAKVRQSPINQFPYSHHAQFTPSMHWAMMRLLAHKPAWKIATILREAVDFYFKAFDAQYRHENGGGDHGR